MSTNYLFLYSRHSRLVTPDSRLSHIQPRSPYDFYHPYDSLPVTPSEAPVGILRRCCSRGHIRLRATAWHGCILMVWLNNSHDSTGTPCGARAGIVREYSMFLISYGTRAGPARVPYGALTDTQGNWHNQNWQNPSRASYFAVRGPYGSRTGCSRAV